MPEIEVKPEHADDPNTRRVGILVGVVGILLSVVTIASHRAHTDAVIHRTESNDLWTYYQAKKIRENTDEVAQSLLQTLSNEPAKIESAMKKLDAARAKYAADAEKLQDDARGKDKETELEERRALFFDIGEGLLELGLVLCSLYFLARKAFFPALGIIAGIAGTSLGIWGALLGTWSSGA
jgi:cytochrome c556